MNFTKNSLLMDNNTILIGTITSLQKAISGDQEVNSITTTLVLWMSVNPSVGNHPITVENPTDTNLVTL